ncbi:MAG: UvrD-helicase domain-containing protein, partial [Clostridia bacterium]|nr:UvrD-helicase domain-containing protein [Clostridia bacterium]
MANNKLTPAQEKAIYSEGKNLLVSASAGSGKTFVMIERVIRLIVEGKAEVGEILAVTYTNLAAEEMKQKLIRAVVKKINEGKDAERFKRALEDIPTAAISTFHSFCANLLRSSFYAAGVDPTFSVADEVRTKELKKRAIDGLFNKKYEERDPEFLYLSEIMRDKRSDESFKSTVLTLWEFASSEADPDEYLSSHANDITEENFYKTLGSLADIYKTKIGSYGKGFSLLKDEAEGLGKSKYIEFLAGLADTSQEIAKADLTIAAGKANALLEV